MMLLTPIIHRRDVRLDDPANESRTRRPLLRPLVAHRRHGHVLFGVMQLMANQFGFDRDGFRVFVLCARPGATFCWARTWRSPRWLLAMAALLLAILQVVCPMRWDHLLSMVPAVRLDVSVVLHL